MELTTYGFYVFTSEVDDHGVDFVMKNSKGHFFEVQVKAARTKTTSYVFAPKSKFDVHNEYMLLALVLLDEDKIPMMYLVPAHAWKSENNLFKNRDFEGRKSEPEWGLNISKKNLPLLDEYRVERQGIILYNT
ncbi:MAG: DUF4365 domain-containing protein [Clostridiales bacterium]|nr:DUF4365 domain-containing protein [Clostridiales bacterium]